MNLPNKPKMWKTPLMIIIILIYSRIESVHPQGKDTLIINLENVREDDSFLKGAIINVNRVDHVKSFCIRFLVTKSDKSITLFNATPFKNFRLKIFFKEKYGHVWMNHHQMIFEITHPIVPFVYHHLCFSQNGTQYSIAVDGELWYSFAIQESNQNAVNHAMKIDTIGFGPLGEDVNLPGGYFLGKVSEFYIFTNHFNSEQLKIMSKQCDKIEAGSKILDWSGLQESNVSIPDGVDIILEKENVSEVCSTSRAKKFNLLPFALIAEKASTSCKSLGGQIWAPGSQTDIEDLRNLFDEKSPVFQNLAKSCGNGKNVWLPFYKYDENSWTTMDNRSKIVTPNFPIVRNGNDLQNCSTFSTNTFYHGDVVCLAEYCCACIWDQTITFKLRGLNKGSHIEDRYVLTNDFLFNGLIGKNKKWL